MITTLPNHLRPMVEKAAHSLRETFCKSADMPFKALDLNNDFEKRLLEGYVNEAEAAVLTFLNACLEADVAKHYEALNVFGQPSEPAKFILNLGKV